MYEKKLRNGLDNYIQYLKTHRKEGNTRVEKMLLIPSFLVAGIL